MKGTRFFPEAASNIATQIDLVYFFLVALTVVICVGVLIAICFMLVKYRRRDPNEVGEGAVDAEALEITWTVIPLIIGVVIFFMGVGPYLEVRKVPSEALQISVVGKQWMWKFQHPNGRREINNLHIPINRPIHLRMISEDVIHSVFVPAFRVKQDALPMYYTSLSFTPTRVGEYYLLCTEYCGEDHSVMGGKVTVMRQAEYDQWLSLDPAAGPAVAGGAPVMASAGGATSSASSGGNPLVEEGKGLFTSLTCVTCHGQKTGGIGPWLFGRYGKSAQIEGGRTVKFDDNYIRESILRPSAKISKGYPNAMTPFQGRVSEEQILALIAYLKAGSK